MKSNRKTAQEDQGGGTLQDYELEEEESKTASEQQE